MNLSSSSKLGWIVMTLVAMACGPDAGGGDATTEGSSSGGASSSGDVMTSSGPPMTSVGTSNGEGSTSSADVTTDTPGDTTAVADSGSATSGESSTGEPPAVTYPQCEPVDPPCPEPYERCAQVGGGGAGGGLGSWCTLGCMDASECPDPSSGTAVPACGGPPGQDPFCQLDCSRGECPDGMECVGVGPMMQIQLCVWPN